MPDSRRRRRKLIFTIAMVLVAFVVFSINTSLPAGNLLCDSNIYTVTDTEDDCIASCRAGGRSACNAKFGDDDNGNPCTNFGDSHVHQAEGSENNTCWCIMSCEVSACRDCDEQCDDSSAECP